MTTSYNMAIVTEPGRIALVERTLPPFGPHDVLIDVQTASICGSDIHIFKGLHPSAPLPMAVGHEVMGVVRETGSEVSVLTPGERVCVEPVVVCGRCHFCLRGEYSLCLNISFQYRKGQGGFAPYFVVDERWAHRLPESLSDTEGALIEPLAVCVHAVRRGKVGFGDRVAVIGDGSIGLLIARVARVAGAEVILVGGQPHKLAAARRLGVTLAIDYHKADPVETVLAHTDGLGVDIAFEAVGLEATLVQSMKVLRKGGTAVVVGIFEEGEVSIPANLFIQREITVTGSQGYCWDFPTAIGLAATGEARLNEIITHTLPLADLQQGFDLAVSPESGAIKVVHRVG